MGLLIFWQLLAFLVHNEIICPSPGSVFSSMIMQCQRPDFFRILATTALRALEGLLVSFVFGVLGASVAFFWKPFRFVLNNLVSFMQAVPNVCYIILVLFWTSRSMTILIVIICLIFPFVYRSFLSGFLEIWKKQQDVFLIYPQPWYIILTRACFPQMQAQFASCLLSGCSMAFKATVMAEVLTSVSMGIGRSLQSARVNVEVAQVVAWTIWLLLLAFLTEKCLRALLRWIYTEKED